MCERVRIALDDVEVRDARATLRTGVGRAQAGKTSVPPGPAAPETRGGESRGTADWRRAWGVIRPNGSRMLVAATCAASPRRGLENKTEVLNLNVHVHVSLGVG
jgi:hypothetical protein